MKKTSITCDVCGKELCDGIPDLGNLMIMMLDPKYTDKIACEMILKNNLGTEKHYDLCSDCINKYSKAIEDFVAKEDKKND